MPVPRTPLKGSNPVHQLSILVEIQRIKLLAAHCLISIVLALQLMMTNSHLRNCNSQMTLTIVIMIKWQIQFAKKHTWEKKVGLPNQN